MLRRVQSEQAPSQEISTTPEELSEAVALVRRQREEATRREREADALAAALVELGEDVTPQDLLDAVAAVRARRTQPRRSHRPRLLFTSLAVTALVFFGGVVFFKARVSAQASAAAAQAERATLIRQMSLDLTGLPPPPAQFDAFVTGSDSRAAMGIPVR